MTGCWARRSRLLACSWSSSRCRGVRRVCAPRGSTGRPRWRSRPGAGRRACASRPSAARAGARRACAADGCSSTRATRRGPSGGVSSPRTGSCSSSRSMVAGRADPDPLYLVCSHGRHDPCCGQRGPPLVAGLAASRPERVWQASHLGGCRFAPTVLVLPLGLMYGRVPPSAADELIAATEAGEVAAGCCADASASRRPHRPRSASLTSSWARPARMICPWSRRPRSTGDRAGADRQPAGPLRRHRRAGARRCRPGSRVPPPGRACS